MNWYKFYGQDFLTDPKIKALSVLHQLAWIYLLCLASQNDGKIKFLTIYSLSGMMGLQPTDDDWENMEGCFEIFEKLEMIKIDNDDNKMITILRYHDRQQSNLSSYERVKRYREKHKSEAKNDNVDNVIIDNARLDKNRLDKNILDKNILDKNILKNNKENSLSIKNSIENISQNDIEKISQDYQVPESFVRSKMDDIKNYTASTGKKYKDYTATLRNWVKRDAFKMRKEASQHESKRGIDARSIE